MTSYFLCETNLFGLWRFLYKSQKLIASGIQLCRFRLKLGGGSPQNFSGEKLEKVSLRSKFSGCGVCGVFTTYLRFVVSRFLVFVRVSGMPVAKFRGRGEL